MIATGAIKVMDGGRDFGVSRVNLATGQGGSGRQAGSAFKPFTLAAAMEARYALSSKWNGPATITIPDQACYTDGKPWTLSNASDEESGVFTLRDATAHSVNTVYAQLVSLVGPAAVVDVAHRLGITSDLQPYCSITLGTEGVNPLEMTTAYATLAARGIRHDASPVLAVEDVAGNQLQSLEPRGQQVLAQNDADLVTYALQSVITTGTGTRAQIGRPAAGKTGTAQDYVDAWFCGYTPQLATCVWVGYPDAERPLQNIGGFSALYGGTIPALIWHDVMTAAMDGQPVEDFVQPSFDGYTLMAPMHSTTTYLINNAGQAVRTWKSKYEPGRSAYLLENGHMIRACMMMNGGPSTGGGEGGRIEEYDWEGNLVWSIDYLSSTYIHHHDFKVLPNGNVLLLAAEKKTLAEVLAAGFKLDGESNVLANPADNRSGTHRGKERAKCSTSDHWKNILKEASFR